MVNDDETADRDEEKDDPEPEDKLELPEGLRGNIFGATFTAGVVCLAIRGEGGVDCETIGVENEVRLSTLVSSIK